MKIEYTEELPTAAEYKDLFDTTGWNQGYRASTDDLCKALRLSWYILCAYDSGRLVGFGRVVSDGVLYAMIYDLIVTPSHQGKGIGSKILHRIIDRCQEACIREVQLFSATGRSEFYQKRGFEVRAPDAPGMRLRKK
ncbi:MAG: GNAT family N-acetyltransferase [Desulfobacterales bacterium]|nr:GNAT family N-acetyltransferase [Desulfobacterales bacterium]